ncbi:MAG: hypothetical protein ACLS7Q_08470 [Varibaculum cambriense]
MTTLEKSEKSVPSKSPALDQETSSLVRGAATLPAARAAFSIFVLFSLWRSC